MTVLSPSRRVSHTFGVVHQPFAGTSDSPYAVVTAGDVSFTDILDLLRGALGESSIARRDLPAWQWKHERNPFGTSYGRAARTADSRALAGLRMMARWRFVEGDGAAISAARAVDTATAAAHRRKGVFSELTGLAIRELRNEGVELIFNSPNEVSLRGYAKLGWESLEPRTLCFLTRDDERFLTARAGNRRPRSEEGAAWGACFGPEFLEWHDFRRGTGDGLEALVASNERARSRHGLRTDRTIRYLDWRYGTHPHVRYAVYGTSDSDGLSGAAILRSNRRAGLDEAVIAELFVRTGTSHAYASLLDSVLRVLRADYAVAHFHPSSREAEAVASCGCRTIEGEAIALVAHPLANAGETARPPRLDLSLGDLELF